MRTWCSGLLLIATLTLSQTKPPATVPRTILVLYNSTYDTETKFMIDAKGQTSVMGMQLPV